MIGGHLRILGTIRLGLGSLGRMVYFFSLLRVFLGFNLGTVFLITFFVGIEKLKKIYADK